MRIKLFFVVFVFLFIPGVYFYVSQFKKPIPLGQIEAQLSSNEVLTEKQLKDIVKNFENRDLYMEDDFNSENIINEIAFLTSSDSILIREIEKAQSGSHDDRSKFIDKNTTELYYLCLKLLNENIHQQYLKTDTLESMEKRNQIIDWIAENLDKLRTSEFLKSQILFYKSMDGNKLRQKLLLEHCINRSRQYLQSNPPKSIFWINKALSYARNLGDQSAFYILISRIQFLLIEYFGFTNTAVKLGDYYIEQASHIDYDLLIAALYYLNGMTRIDKGEYSAAIEDFNMALKIYKTFNHTRMLPAIYGRFGVVYRHMGDFDKAFVQFENVRLYKEPHHEMLYYLETGLLFAETGEFSKADHAYHKSLDLAKQLDNISNQVVALTNLSNLYFELGDLQAAFSFNEQALKVAEQAPNPVVIINIWFSLAEFCAINNDFEKARDYASKATEYLSKHDFGLLSAISYLTAGKLQLKIGQFQEALASLQSSLTGFNKIQDLTRQIKTLNLIGETCRNLKDYGNALGFLNKAKELSDVFGNFSENWLTQYYLARVYEDLAQDGKAIEYLEKSIKNIHAMTSGLNNYEQRLNFSQKINMAYEQMVLMQLKNKQIEKAFYFSDSSKAQVLNLMLREKEFNTIAAAAPKVSTTNSNAKKTQPTLTVLQSQLDEDSVVLEYEVTENELVIWFISKKHIKADTIKINRSEIDSLTKDFRTLMNPDSVNTPDKVKKTFPKTIALGQQFYKILIEPFQQEISNKKLIYIIADETLNYLPFAAIVDLNSTYLVEKVAICYFSSACILSSSLQKMQSPRKTDSVLLAVSTDGSGKSFKDAVEVAKFYDNKEVLIGNDATEENLSQILGNKLFQSILFSVHGLIDEKKPSNSYLKLTKTSQSDGRLTVSEIMSKDLKGTDLVYLAACKSASGRLYRGEGTLSIQRAFTLSGVNTVIANLWEIASNFSDILTTDFFKNRMGKQNKVNAIRLSQIFMINKLKGEQTAPHPYFWAPLIITGQIN